MTELEENVAGGRSHALLYETRYQPDEDDSLAFCIVDAVASAAGISPLNLDDQLYHAIDPDALDCVIQSYGLGPEGYVTFEFAGYEVVTHSSGLVSVYEG